MPSSADWIVKYFLAVSCNGVRRHHRVVQLGIGIACLIAGEI